MDNILEGNIEEKAIDILFAVAEPIETKDSNTYSRKSQT